MSRSRVSRVILRLELKALAGGRQIVPKSRKPPISLNSFIRSKV